MPHDLTKFRNFLADEIHKRDMSIREFALFVGLTHTTIAKYLNPNDNRTPTLDSVVAISKKTGAPIDMLLAMIYPDIDSRLLRTDDKTIELVQKIVQLPPEKREIIEAFIIGTILQNTQKST